MSRKFIDCREVPSESKCSVLIAADRDDELIEAAVQHAIAVHHERDSDELRGAIRSAIKDESPPA